MEFHWGLYDFEFTEEFYELEDEISAKLVWQYIEITLDKKTQGGVICVQNKR